MELDNTEIKFEKEREYSFVYEYKQDQVIKMRI